MRLRSTEADSTRRPATSAVAATPSRTAMCETLEDRRMMASDLAYGINANNVSSSTYDATVRMLRDTGTKSVRLWYGFSSYGDRGEAGIIKYVRRFAADGFDVTLSVVPSGGRTGSPDQVKGLINHLVNLPGMASAVDRWQIGNEPDHDHYWQGSLSSYVTNFLKPASEVLHARGEKVVSAGPSWNPEDVRTMVNAGMLKYADFVGYHPYRSTLSDLKTRVAQVKSIVGGKPLIASEWNIRGREGDKTAWNAGIKEFWPVIRDNFYAAYYYAAIKSTTMAGAAGVLTTSGGQNGAFYSTYKGLRASLFSSGSTVGTTSGSTSSSTGTTTTATSTGTASISGTLFWDNDRDGKRDTGEVGQSGKVVFIDSDGDGYLDSNEKRTTTDSSGNFTFTGLNAGTYKIRRVVPTGYTVTTPLVSTTITTGQKYTGVFIGSNTK